MRTPARRVILDAIFWQMPRHVDHARTTRLNTAVEWRITGGSEDRVDTYRLVFEDGRCRSVRGSRGPEPRVTITVDGAEFLRLATGSSAPLRAYFSGRLSLRGDIMLAAKLGSLFLIPGKQRS